MADSSHHPDASDGSGAGPDRGSPDNGRPGTPRWVKSWAITVGVLILLVVIVRLTGLGGEHGPGRHMGAAVITTTGVTAVADLSGGNPDDYASLGRSYS